MTGIERLRKLSEDMLSLSLWVRLTTRAEKDWDCYQGDGRTVNDELLSIADQIEHEHACDADTIENIRLIVGGVVTDMERHVSGVEGADDSPVARWARVLREALGGDGRDPAADVSMSAYDLLPADERDALAWVRDHGGLDHVRAEWRSRVPYDLYQRRRQRLLDHIAECETALGSRNQRIEKLGKTIEFFQLNNSNFRHLLADVAERLGFTRFGDDYEPDDLLDALDRRLMPEGMEWPTVDGKPVVIGERMRSCGIDDCKVVGIDPANSRLTLASDNIEEGKATYFTDRAEYCHRPMPKVLDADGVEIREGDVLYRKSDGRMVEVAEVYEKTFIDADDCVRPGDGFTHRAPVFAADGMPLREGEHVYHVETGAELVVKELPKPGEYQAVVVFAPPASHPTSFDPCQLTHQRPVLDADGVPIKKGDTVYLLPGDWCDEFPCLGFHGGEELEVFDDEEAVHVSGGVQCREKEKKVGFRGYCYPQPSQLTHTKPAIDSWERIEEDAGCTATKYNERRGTIFTTKQQVARDLVRRCRALAERERGER